MPGTDHVFLQQAAADDLKTAQVNIAVLEERVANLARTVEELRKSSDHMVAAIDAMQKTMAEARGGWRTLVLLGGMLTALGGFLTWLATHFTWNGTP